MLRLVQKHLLPITMMRSALGSSRESDRLCRGAERSLLHLPHAFQFDESAKQIGTIKPIAEGRGQKAEGRRQKAEGSKLRKSRVSTIKNVLITLAVAIKLAGVKKSGNFCETRLLSVRFIYAHLLITPLKFSFAGEV